MIERTSLSRQPNAGISLKEKLAERAKRQKANETNWEARKELWIAQVMQLYKDVNDWCQEYVNEQYMTFDLSKKIQLTEKDMGTYEINMLEIDIEGDLVVFEPFGANVIGAFGRIDLYLRGHKADKAMLLLFEREGEDEQHWQWVLAFEEWRFDFNKARFEELLLDWFERLTE